MNIQDLLSQLIEAVSTRNEEKLAPAIGKPVLVRHVTSGVMIGYLRGPGIFPDSVVIEGRKVWSWQGGRLELSQLAEKGCRESDKLGEWEEVTIGSLTTNLSEWRIISPEIVEHAKSLKSHSV